MASTRVASLVVIFTIVMTAFACPNDTWTLYEADQTCLKVFYTTIATWTVARNACMEYDGGDLVMIKDNDKNNFVYDMASGLYYYPFIGVSSNDNNSMNFEYVDGTPLGDFHPWYKKDPVGEHKTCVHMMTYPTHPGEWTDFYCTAPSPYVCSVPNS